MTQRFRYNRDKQTKRRTWIISAAIAAVFALVILLVGEEYVRAWIVVMMLTLLLLYLLSIPRYIKVDRDALEIHCIVEMTRIAIDDINSVRKVTSRDIGRLVPLIGSCGFFGYFGYYADLRNWEIIRVYAGEWAHFVEIEDIYEDKYLVSCRQPDRLIESVVQAKLINAADKPEQTIIRAGKKPL